MKQYNVPKIEVFTLSDRDDVIRTSGLTLKNAGQGGSLSMNDFESI